MFEIWPDFVAVSLRFKMAIACYSRASKMNGDRVAISGRHCRGIETCCFVKSDQDLEGMPNQTNWRLNGDRFAIAQPPRTYPVEFPTAQSTETETYGATYLPVCSLRSDTWNVQDP